MAPPVVIAASVLQYLIAATFVVITVIAYRYGTDAQRAAQAEVARQGFPVEVLARHRVKFSEGAVDALFPFGIAVCLTVLGTLNLAGSDVGRILTWILQPILLVGGGLTTAAQVFPVRYVAPAFAKSGDAARGIDVQAFIGAAQRAFPRLLRPLVITRFALVTAGSVLVIILLAVPSANAWFR
ncbi:hypothetical protein AAH979_14070 [Plantactinospora sp. ZYX-F-223]|uniref:hypothetical protein n=1 Tax=Plantactinospora sp. ZYX-F-223 TaxID=3144103 RepID=UPI0031FE06F9